ncbi:hypothetical protein [Tardiphaga sp. 839_C3_N1_4]|uniref:hypothetical protein n=1 Tax=Tardiphaga sp. 839_C3_N1_4 TaxID=3240761 RepID=UPI003F23AC95
MFHSPAKHLLYTAYKLAVEHVHPNGHSIKIVGTAFYITRGSEMYLITNRHNVDAVMKAEKYAGYRPDSLELSGYFGGKYLHARLADDISIGFPENVDEDVAAINLTNVRFATEPPEHEMRVNYISYDSIADEKQLASLSICDMVALPGYPDFYDRNGERPIMRMGTIASDPESNYQDIDMSPARRIAYEAFSSAGSSGSPVFALAKGWKAGQGLSGGYFRDLLLVGVNAGHLRGRDDMHGSHSGISYCFKSACIIEAIDEAKLP